MGKMKGNNSLKGMKELSFKDLTRLAAPLKCLYTNAHSLGSKQEMLESVVLNLYGERFALCCSHLRVTVYLA